MTMFGSIGKSPIIKAIGLQDNYAIVTDKLNLEASGCYECNTFLSLQKYKKNPASPEYQAALLECQNCKTKSRYKTYINEKSRYGDGDPLNLIAIKLFLLLHLSNPNAIGIVRAFHVPTAAKKIGCSEKSVHSSLKELQAKDYISYFSAPERGYYVIILNDYASYFLPASKGGRGYFVISDTLLQELFSIDKINVMRLYLREYINIDNKKSIYSASLSPDDTIRKDERSMSELRRYLPSYLKPCNIHHLLNQNTAIYSIIKSDKITFILNDTWYAEEEKRRMEQENRERLLDHIDETNQLLEKRSRTWISEDEIPLYLHATVRSIIATKEPVQIQLDSKDIDDIVQMSVQYSYDEVLSELHTCWSRKPITHQKENYAPILRNNILSNRLAAA